jgi:hypothetical protein
MAGKGSIHKHGSTRSKVAGNLSAKFPGHAVNRSFNAFARGQVLQACLEILVGCADYLIASEVVNDRFLLAPPDNVDCLESILPRQLKHEFPDAGCSRRLQKPVALLEIVT